MCLREQSYVNYNAAHNYVSDHLQASFSGRLADLAASLQWSLSFLQVDDVKFVGLVS